MNLHRPAGFVGVRLRNGIHNVGMLIAVQSAKLVDPDAAVNPVPFPLPGNPAPRSRQEGQHLYEQRIAGDLRDGGMKCAVGCFTVEAILLLPSGFHFGPQCLHIIRASLPCGFRGNLWLQ